MGSATPAATPVANGTAATYRLTDAADNELFSGGTVTDTAGAGPCKLNNLNIVTTSDVTLTAFSHTEA
jgi:hypothetical protein